MTKTGRMIFRGLAAALSLASTAALAHTPPIVGKWVGTVKQNAGSTGYTVILTITESGADTFYPELDCGGVLSRVGNSEHYVFYTEGISHGGIGDGGRCIDGTITIAPAGDGKMSWGWVGSHGGMVYVAWSDLTRKDQ